MGDIMNSCCQKYFRFSGFHSLIQIGEYVRHIYLSLNSALILLLFFHSHPYFVLGIRRFLLFCIGIPLISSSLTAVAIEEPQNQNAVEEFLTKEISGILQYPDIVESYLVYPELDPNVLDKPQLAGFCIVQRGPNLTTEQIEQFKTVVFDSKSYATSIKKCVFRPELGLLFKKGKQQVEFLLSTGCDKWLFVSDGRQKQGDYRRSAKASLLKLLDALFPAKPD
jgi:hypothetical protein